MMTGEEILAKARQMAGPQPYFRPEDWEDEVGAIALALCERRGDPVAALKAERSRRWKYWAKHVPLFAGSTGEEYDDDYSGN